MKNTTRLQRNDRSFIYCQSADHCLKGFTGEKHRAQFRISSHLLFAVLAFASFCSTGTNAQTQSQSFTSSGTFTIPANVTSIIVETWGGGGRGATRSIISGAGGGGGGGAYARKTMTVAPTTPYTVTIGAGSSSTAAGGDSWFGSTTTVLAKGGNSASGTTGASGGLGSASVGDTKTNGGTGSNSGGGGSSGGSAANGNPGSGGSGGAAPTGGAAGGGTLAAGSVPGGGGGSGAFSVAPGNGGGGRVTVTWTLPTITSFTPSAICTEGSHNVVLTGTAFTGATSVNFNGIAATSFTVNSATSISAVAPPNASSGTVTVTTPNGTGTSLVTFKVNVNPTVAPVTGESSVCLPDTNTVALNSDTPTGVWTSSNVDIASISATGIITPHTAGNVVISYVVTSFGCSTTQTFPFTVYNPINIISSTSAQTVVTGGNTFFSVIAAGSPLQSASQLQYQWESSPDGELFTALTNDAVYNGVASPTLTLTGVPQSFDQTYYRVIITGACSTEITNIATLTVGETAVTNPDDVLLCDSNTAGATFSVTASADVTNFQWQADPGGDNWADITDSVIYSGSQTSTLSLSNIPVSYSGYRYKVIVTGFAVAESSPATLIVIPSPVIATNPQNQTVCYTGGSAIFNVDASIGVSSYQWQYSENNGATWSNVSSGIPTGASYTGTATESLSVTTTAATPASGTYLYRAVIGAISPCSTSAISTSVQLLINTPAITSQPASLSVGAGSSAAFSIATSAASPTYQWQFSTTAGGTFANVVNGTPAGITYTGATSSTLTVNVASSAAAGNARFYRAVLSSPAGCSVNSNAGQLTTTTYCSPSVLLGGSGDIISNVTISNPAQGTSFSQASSGASPYFTVYNNTPFSVIQGQDLAVAITFGTDDTQYSAIWIDYNKNGTFEAAENVGLATSANGASTTRTYLFTIPFTATPGTVRVRVSGGADSAYAAGTPCPSTLYGETEDYFLNIIAAQPCTGNPVAGIAATSVSNICNSGTAVLSVSGYTTGVTGISMQWHNTVSGAIAGATSATYTTPVLTAAASFFIRVTCANGGFTDSNTITINYTNPTITTTTPNSRCGAGSITLSATGSAGSTISWYAAATGGTPLATGAGFTIPNLAATTTFYAGSNIGTCFSASRTAVTATINTPPGLTLSASNGTICSGGTTGLVTIASGAGSYDSFNWSPSAGISGSPEAGYTFNPTITTIYTLSASSSSSLCNNSVTYTVNVNPLPATLTISPSDFTYCPANNAVLMTATGGSVANVPILTENFNNSAPAWTITNGGSSPAAANWAYVNAPYNDTSGQSFSNFSTPNGGKFAMANAESASLGSTTNTILISPVFSTVGYSAATLTFEQVYNSLADTTVKVEISTNGGSTWVQLASYGGTSQGSTTANAQVAATSTVSLNAYINQANLRIRYNYNTFLGYYWIVDNVRITGTDPGKVVWSPQAGLYTDAAATTPYTGGISTVVYARPTVAATYIATVTALTGCINSAQVNVGVAVANNYYADADQDGFGSTSSVYACTAPAGYVTNNTDCDDTNGSVYQTGDFYVDADGDHYTIGTSQTLCYGSSSPVGYSVNTLGTDCDDTNGSVYQSGTFYTDSDGDQYTLGTAQTLCYGAATPVGYSPVSLGTDCNDAIAAINPGHVEVLYNGVDDNCDGQLDEGNLLKTKLLPSVCGKTLASIGSLIGITTVNSTITGYRIKVTNGSSVQIIERNVPHFTLTLLTSHDYATTYSVEIELQRNGIWLGYYGDACLVSSPAVLAETGSAQVSPSQCGITLQRINTLIATTSLANVTGYRFRITNLTSVIGANVVQILDRSINWFSLQMLAQYNYGTTYRIEVAVKTTGDYSGFGSPCEVSSPASPSLTNCGGVASAPGSYVSCASMSGGTQYRFQIMRISDGTTISIDRNANYFTFYMVPGYTPSALYAVRVAVMTTGTWSPMGDACEVTSPSVALRDAFEPTASEDVENQFNAVAWPNPYATEFALHISGNDNDAVEIKIYDMQGRLVEERQANIIEINEAKIGQRYPSGVYNIIISRGSDLKSLRVVKR